MPKHSKIVPGKKTARRDIGPGAPVNDIGAVLVRGIKQNPKLGEALVEQLDPDGTARANVAARKTARANAAARKKRERGGK